MSWVGLSLMNMIVGVASVNKLRNIHMKTELMKIPNRGLCIVISELDAKEIIKGLGGECPDFGGGIFKDIYIIADFIREGKKIPAIKEIRSQTGWGLKDAKVYCDRFIPMGGNYESENYNVYADKFIRYHMPPDFIKDQEFEL